MRRLAGVAALCTVLALSAGCATYRAPVVPPVGLLYSAFKAPLTTEFSGQAAELKSGEASTSSVLGLVATGDCSLEAAAHEGGLNTIEYCDYSYLNVLGVYQRFTVVAYGR